jgi:hypothetical protein
MMWTLLRMNEERILKKVLNMKVKGKCPRWRLQSRWEQWLRKIGYRGKDVHGKELWEYSEMGHLVVRQPS